MPKQGNNRGAAPCPDEDSQAVEAFFMRLGNVLAEIARNMLQREANGNQDLPKNRANRNQNKKRKD